MSQYCIEYVYAALEQAMHSPRPHDEQEVVEGPHRDGDDGEESLTSEREWKQRAYAYRQVDGELPTIQNRNHK